MEENIFDLKLRKRNIPESELTEDLVNVAKMVGKATITGLIFDEKGLFGKTTILRRLGSWNKALIRFITFIKQPDTKFPGNTIKTEKALDKNISNNTRNINWRLRATVLIRDNCICKMCGASPAKNSKTTLHVDHIIPWSNGGQTVMENLQTPIVRLGESRGSAGSAIIIRKLADRCGKVLRIKKDDR
jgi:hypothetical protein